MEFENGINREIDSAAPLTSHSFVIYPHELTS